MRRRNQAVKLGAALHSIAGFLTGGMRLTNETRKNQRTALLAVAGGFAMLVLVYSIWPDRSEQGHEQQLVSAQDANVAHKSASHSLPEKQAVPYLGNRLVVQDTGGPVLSAKSKSPSNDFSRGDNAPTESITISERDYSQNQGAAHSEQADTAGQSELLLQERVQIKEIRVNVGDCQACSRVKTDGIRIPRSCTYASHTITQLKREPYAPIDQGTDQYTYYIDSVTRDAKGRIEVVELTVGANNMGTRARDMSPSITMGLSVVAMCPGE